MAVVLVVVFSWLPLDRLSRAVVKVLGWQPFLFHLPDGGPPGYSLGWTAAAVPGPGSSSAAAACGRRCRIFDHLAFSLAFECWTSLSTCLPRIRVSYKAYQLAQQAQQAQEQIAAWWTAAAQNHTPAKDKEAATPAVDISQFVKEAVDKRITEEWQKDEKNISHLKSVQEKQAKESSETEATVKKPLPKARPYPMERIGAMEVSAGDTGGLLPLDPQEDGTHGDRDHRFGRWQREGMPRLPSAASRWSPAVLLRAT